MYERLGLDILAVDIDFALVEAHDAAAGLYGGRLAGAVVAYEAVYFAGADVQSEVVHGFLVAVGLGQMFDSEHGYALLALIGGSVPHDF